MDAVSTLVHSGKLNSVLPVANYSNKFALPESSSDFKAAESYLLHRGISQEILMLLVEKKLIYQDRRQNVVFVNEGRDFCEVRGTYPSKSFHQCRKASADGYWAFSLIDDPQSAFICEAAIDALSLLQLHLCNPSVPMTAAYCSIAGVMNQEAILRIAEKYPSVLASRLYLLKSFLCALSCLSLRRLFDGLCLFGQLFSFFVGGVVVIIEPCLDSFFSCEFKRGHKVFKVFVRNVDGLSIEIVFHTVHFLSFDKSIIRDAS